MPPPKDPIKFKEYLERQSKSKKGQVPWNKGKKHKSESIEKMRIAHLGKSSPRKGKHHSEKTKKLLSKIHKGQHYSRETEFKKGRVSNRKGITMSENQKELLRKINTGRTSWNKGKKGLQTAWNKGLTKDTDPRVKNISESLKQYLQNPEAREVLRITNTGRKSSPETCKKISKAKTGIRHKPESIAKYKAWRATQVLPVKDTKPEKMMQIALALNGIKFEKHKPFKLGRRWHQVDIFIEPNICVEVDGIHWHIYPKDIKRDMFQTQELTVMGYHVIRIREKDILKNTQNCAEKVINLIKELKYHYPLHS